MTRREKSWLDERLAQLSGNERQRLYKQAAKLRKQAQNGRGGGADTGRRHTALMEEDGPGFQKLARGPSGSLDDWVMRLLKEEEPEVIKRASHVDSELLDGLVVAVGAGRCTVRTREQVFDCLLRPELTVTQQSAIAVGDDVRFSLDGDLGPMVEEVLPRRATLSRPDPFYGHIERVVAANIDAVVIVVSVITPPLHPKLIDRYLIAVQRGGAVPILCVNKIDLLETEAERRSELAKLRPYHELGLQTLLCSSENGSGIDDLRAALMGRRCVFVGHSGVGKSSLTNALDPSLGLATNTLRQGDGKGRHTTTTSQLYDLPGGIQVIDTPGIREFGLWKLTPEEVRWYFTEFEPHAPDCKFADCSHTHEPTCGVKRAVHHGRLSRSRYESYCRILASL